MARPDQVTELIGGPVEHSVVLLSTLGISVSVHNTTITEWDLLPPQLSRALVPLM